MEDPAWLVIPNTAPAKACNQPAADAETPTMVDRRTLVRALTDYQNKLLDRANHYWFDDNKLKKGSVSLKHVTTMSPGCSSKVKTEKSKIKLLNYLNVPF